MGSVTQALIVGVSEYGKFPGSALSDLPFCKNDASRVYLALEKSLGVRPENAHVLSGCVTRSSVCQALSMLSKDAGDQLIVYFSGHGGMSSDGKSTPSHCLCLSDGCVWTGSVLEAIDSFYRSKLMVIDSCKSGAVMPSEDELRRSTFVERPGTGTLIVMSSHSDQPSSNYCPSGSPSGTGGAMSAFTHMLCAAMNGYYGTQSPTIDFMDVLDYCQRLNHAYNGRVACAHRQQMVVYGDVAGGFAFPNPRYIEKRPVGKGEQELCGGRAWFEPCHAHHKKRYRACVVIDGDTNSVEVIKEAIVRGRSLEVYSDESEAERLRNVGVNRVVGHAFATEKDLDRSNPRFHFCWTSDGEPAPKLASGKRLYSQGGLTIVEIGSYRAISQVMEDNSMDSVEVWYASTSVIPQVELLKRHASNLIDKFDSGLATRGDLMRFHADNWAEVMRLANYPFEIGYPEDSRMEPLVNKLCGLTGCLHDIVLNCSERAIATRGTDAEITSSVKASIRMYNDDYAEFYKIAEELDPAWPA